MSEGNESGKTFDTFELMVAVLIGLGAVGIAWSGYQSGLWGGKMSEAYSEAAKMTAEAGAFNNDMLVEMSHDQTVDLEAKKLIVSARDTSNQTDYARNVELASYLYLYQLSHEAYQSLGLPEDLRKRANETPPKGQEPEEVLIPEEALLDAYYVDLDDVYYAKKFEEVTEMFDAADTRFDEGRNANDIGDQFDLAGVIFTVGLFFAGISLVLKSRVRWAFYGMGLVTFLAAFTYMLTLPSSIIKSDCFSIALGKEEE